MKKENGLKNAVKLKYVFIVAAAALLISLPVRVYQLLTMVETSSGFFNEDNFTVWLFYGVAVVFTVAALVLSYLSKDVPAPSLTVGKNPVLCIASVIMAGGLIWDAFSVITDIVPSNALNNQIFVSILRMNVGAKGAIFSIFECLFAVLSAIYFLVFAVSHINGGGNYRQSKILALSPVCWATASLVTRLMREIPFIRVSDLLIEIFMFIFFALFFLTFARVSSGVFSDKKSMWGIFGYGLVAVFFAALATIPRIVASASGIAAVEGYEFEFSHLAALIFIVAYILAALGVGFKDGVKTRKAVNEMELPDEETVTKKADDTEDFQEETGLN